MDDLSPVLDMVERAAQASADQTSDFQRWDHLMRGLAEYRLGRFAEAIGLLKQRLTAEAKDSYLDGPAYFVLAMAQYRLGQKDEANASLRAGIQLIEPTLRKLERGELLGFNWPDWLRTNVLRREAEALSAGESPAPAASNREK